MAQKSLRKRTPKQGPKFGAKTGALIKGLLCMKAHIGEHTYKSTPVKADIWDHRGEAHIQEHTCESRHMRAQRGEHRGGKPMPKAGSTLCARACSGNAHGHFRRSILCGNLQGICRSRIPGPAVCVEIYRKKCTRTLLKSHFIVRKFIGKNAGPHGEDFDWKPISNCQTVRTHCLGKKKKTKPKLTLLLLHW